MNWPITFNNYSKLNSNLINYTAKDRLRDHKSESTTPLQAATLLLRLHTQLYFNVGFFITSSLVTANLLRLPTDDKSFFMFRKKSATIILLQIIFMISMVGFNV